MVRHQTRNLVPFLYANRFLREPGPSPHHVRGRLSLENAQAASDSAGMAARTQRLRPEAFAA
jgi:hypothetical protein